MKKVGIALGGGGARGVAHIGVLQVLKEYGVPVDYVSGCSAGAIAGALYCTGSDMYLAGKLCESIDMSSFIDIVIPKVGFVKGEKAENLVDMLVKGKNAEDCVPPFCAIACDTVSGKCITLDKGRLSKICRASFAIPGVFEPVESDGMQLVDGGVMTRVPVEQVRAMGADYVIGVDVGYKGTGHEKAKNMMEIIMTAFEMCDWEITKNVYGSCNCVIAPDLEDISSMNLDKAEECLKRGREAAEQAVERILKDIRENERAG